MNKMRERGMEMKKGFGLGVVILLLAAFILTAGQAFAATVDLPQAGQEQAAGLLQFKSGGHVLGFTQEKMYVVGAGYALIEEFVGANKTTPVAGEQSGSPTDASGSLRKSGAPDFHGVTYKSLWHGVDLQYRPDADGFAESVYELAAGADPGSIKLRYNMPFEIQKDGSLKLRTDTGHFMQSPPVAWQETDGGRKAVIAAFKDYGGGVIGFSVGDYDKRRPLIIDPSYSWHTFYGGANTIKDGGQSIVLDPAGNVYIAGYSNADWGSSSPKPLHPFSGVSGRPDIFIMKLDSNGKYIWHTFYGSSGTEESDVGRGIAIDSNDDLYITGNSALTWNGPDINKVNTIQPKHPHHEETDIFVLKLDSNGEYIWHTFYGGTYYDQGYDIAFDSNNYVYVTGESREAWNGPDASGTDNVSPKHGFAGGGGEYDIVILKLDKDGAYQWHTFYGNDIKEKGDAGYGIAVDVNDNDNVYVTGDSDATWNGPDGQGAKHPFEGGDPNVFILKLGTDGAYQWHTFYGTIALVRADIAVDSLSNVYVSGSGTAVSDCPPNHANSGGDDIVVLKFNGGGACLGYTFYGGSGSDYAFGITVDPTDNVYVTGGSLVTWNGPGGPADQPLHKVDDSPYSKLFILKLDSSLTYKWHTFYGGEASGNGYDIAVGSGGDLVYAAGSSGAGFYGGDGDKSDKFPLHDPSGNDDIVVLKIAEKHAITVTNTSDTVSGGTGTIKSDPTGINCGSDLTCTGKFDYDTKVVLTAEATTGSTASWNDTCTTVGGTPGGTSTKATCTFGKLDGAKTDLTATFVKNTYTVTVDPLGETTGTAKIANIDVGVDCSWDGTTKTGKCESRSIYHGTEVTLTATLPTGTLVKTWDTDCSSTTLTTCTISSLEANKTISATFEKQTYTLTYTAGAHGSISGASPQTVKHGGDGTEVVATAAEQGYHFDKWSDESTANPRTDTNVTANIDVTAYFVLDDNTYVVTAVVDGGNGSVDPDEQAITGGSTAKVTATADPNYHVAGMSGCGIVYTNTDTDVNSVNSHTDTTTAITESCTVTTTFAIDQYTVTTTAINGTITSATPNLKVNHGATTTVTGETADGYFKSVSGCGGTKQINDTPSITEFTYTTGNIIGDCTVEAVFEEKLVTDINAGLTGVYNSSVAWGDYDNDGDLDILLTGHTGSVRVSKIYNNGVDTDGKIIFTDINAGLAGLDRTSVAWGDYDNDGDLDILLTGYISSEERVSKIYRNNGGGTFADITAGLPGVYYGSVAWGDYDNDGDLDILLTGHSGSGGVGLSKIYRNDVVDGNRKFNENTSAVLTGVSTSSVAWGDYDNDGDLDILLTGYAKSTLASISKIYYNYVDAQGKRTFAEDANATANLTGVQYGSAAWGDYDNDGDLDILLTGSGKSTIYHNDVDAQGKRTFADISAGLIGVKYSSAAWGDYDNDGDLDILLTGYISDTERVSKIYLNDVDDQGTRTFTGFNAGLTGVQYGSVAWGDYDNDGKLDILLTGYISSTERVSKIYNNDTPTANVAPGAPTTLPAVVNNDTVTLSWDKATDQTTQAGETPQTGLTYNLRIGTSKDAADVFSGMVDTSNGYRRIPAIGNTNHNTEWSLKISGLLDGTTYYWSVQAVDTAFAGGAWAEEGSFVGTAADTEPDAFSFTDQTDVELNGGITSDTITVSGINSAASISITGCTSTSCEYQINSGSWTSDSGTVNNNDTVTVRQTSSGSYSTMTDLTLSIGGVSDTFSVTTKAAYELTVTKAGDGAGTVTSSPAGIDCGSDCSEVYASGKSITLTATADTGSTFTGWSNNFDSTAECYGTNAQTTVTMDAAKTCMAAFTLNTYTISASAGANGSINPNGDVTVIHGTDQSFTITANPNYHVEDVLVDRTSAGAVTSYTFTNVTVNHTISASFAINTYTLTYSAGANGSISGTNPQMVDHGDSGTEVTAEANQGYHFVNWSDGSTANPRRDTNVIADITVEANFELNATCSQDVSTVDEFQTALTTAQDNGCDDIINVAAGTYDITTTLTYKSVNTENYSLTVQGAGADKAILDGGNNVRILLITTGGLADKNAAVITIEGMTFQNGKNSTNGGAVHVSADVVTLTNNIFSGNTAGYDGGGVVISSDSGTVTLTNNTFSGNTAGYDGGGANVELNTDSAKADIYNNIFWGNTANAGGSDGDDLYVDSDPDEIGAGAVNLYNNDFSLGADFATGKSDALYITNTDKYSNDSNITVDPLFVNATEGDFHLKSGSQCIGAGKTDAPSVPEKDFEGDVRMTDGAVDIGADEYVEAIMYTLTVTKTGNGTVMSSEIPLPKINCGEDCSEPYAEDTTVTLTATPADDSTFTGWSGDCSGTANPLDVVMDAAKTCAATFTQSQPVTYLLTVTKTGNGTVMSSEIPLPKINCGSDCEELYDPGTTVTLTAAPEIGWDFTGWSGDCNSSGQITMDAAKTCTATFTQSQPVTYTVTANAESSGFGTVTSSVGDINYHYQNVNTGTTTPLPQGTPVVLTAKADTGSIVSWTTCTGEIAVTNPQTATCTFESLDGDKEATATFETIAPVCVSYVSTDGSGELCSQESPCAFQQALTTAQGNQCDDIINVAAGTYSITTTLTYSTDTGDNGHSLTIIGAGGADKTILDGGKSVQIMYLTTELSGDGDIPGCNINVSGLTFQNGYSFTGDTGGGVLANSSSGSITLTNNTFSGNAADGAAGAAVYSGFGAITLTNNIFNNNTADAFGGGAYIVSVYGAVTLTNNIFSGNIASESDGGGVWAGAVSGAVTLTNNTFSGNTAVNSGGGAYILSYFDSAIVGIYNNIFWQNIANVGGSDGDDLFVESDGDVNSTGSTVNLYNNDFSGNTNFDVPQSEDLVITNTGKYSSGSNMQVDPSFVNAEIGDFHLKPGSPVIGKGKTDAPFMPEKDFEGDDRIINGTVDMGADEYVGYTLTVSKTGTGAGTVASDPLGIDCGGTCKADFNKNQEVTLTATPAEGSTFDGWSMDCNDSGQVTMDDNKTCTAAFTLKTYTISASAGANGSITPNGAVTVNHGSDQSFTITANLNYHVADVLVDGTSVGAVTSYKFTNVTADHTISASFAINQYTVTATISGGNGSATPASQQVSHGDTTTVTATADPNYHVASMKGCGIDYTNTSNAVTSYTGTTAPVTGDCTVTARFAESWQPKNLVLLIHGLMESPDVMDDYYNYLISALPSETYQVEIVDGLDNTYNIYSLSGPDANTQRIETFIYEKTGSEVAELADGSIYFVSHSMGGLISRQFSVWHPGKVGQIFMLGTPNGGMNGLNSSPPAPEYSWASSNMMNCAEGETCWNSDNKAQTAVEHYLFAGTCTDPALIPVEGEPNDGVVGQWSVLKLYEYAQSEEVIIEPYAYNDRHNNASGQTCESNLLEHNVIMDVIANVILGNDKTLTVSTEGPGTVTDDRGYINCGGYCEAAYAYGAQITLTATPADGYVFAGWSGDEDCLNGQVTLDTNKTCTATFNAEASQTWFEETDTAVTYTGRWNSFSCPSCSGGAIKYSGRKGNKIDFAFNGTGIKWIAAKHKRMGKANVYIDGVFRETVSLYALTVKFQETVFNAIGLTAEEHTITIEAAGLKNLDSLGYYVNLDAFEVTP